MKLADYVINYLKDIGIKQVFLLYGAATGDLVDAFSRIKGIDYICTIHEQAGSFAVEARAKVTGKIQCFIATSAPGGINTLNGIANAYYDSTPCLFITGQVNQRFLVKDKAQRQIGFQENDIVAMSKPITKYATMVRYPKDIRYELEKAVYLATHGRQGSVLLDIPVDVQKADIEPENLASFPIPIMVDYYNHDQEANPEKSWYGYQEFVLNSLIQDLQSSNRPVILVGGGVWWAKAQDLVRELGEKLKIPVFPTWNATDIITSDYAYYGGRVGTFGGAGRNFGIQNSDLLLAIGTRISGRITGGYVESFARKAKKYIIDIDKAMLNNETQEVKGHVNLCVDAKYFIEKLLEELDGIKINSHSGWWDLVKEWRDKYITCLPGYYNSDFVHPYVFVKELSKVCGKHDVIFCDSGGNAVATFQNFETQYGQRLISSNGNSCMGQSFSEALGVSFLPEYLKEKKGHVICISGDGGFQMNIQDLQTVKHYGLRLKMFILNNLCYGVTKQYQETNFGGRYLASGVDGDGYSVPDFCNIAIAYGLKTMRINNMHNLSSIIKGILDCTEAIVVDVNCKGHTRYVPRIFGWKTPIEDAEPYLPRDEFRKNMIIEPYEGWEHPAMPNGDSNQSIGLA